jgi:hypothetical protein
MKMTAFWMCGRIVPLMVEAVRTSEISIVAYFSDTARRYIPEG